MRIPRIILLCLLSLLVSFAVTLPGTCFESDSVVAHWPLDEKAGAESSDKILGMRRFVPGVSGNALRFDGYTTHVIRPVAQVPKLGEQFSIEAWIVIDAYPWNWVPIVDHSQYRQVGYFFGVDAWGHLGLQADVDGVWQSLTSTEELSLKKWIHVAGTFDAARGLNLFINGKPAGGLAVRGGMRPADRADLMIGRVREPMIPVPGDAIHPRDPVGYSFDGIIDEIRIHGRVLSAEEVQKSCAAVQAPQGEVLPWAKLPSGPPGAGSFGAYYATLKFHDAWDALRRVGPDSEVVVRFDQSPIRLVFWQGMNYIPAWVTENGKWYTDEFLETYREMCPGDDCEPMSDKQSRYSRVRILESTEARAVIHWRYALADAEHYRGALPDPYTGWFDWADEYWTVYPDGVAVRKQVLWSTEPTKDHEWHESIVINAPGERPEDNINLDALTVANMKGETATYTWSTKPFRVFERPHGPEKVDRPDNPNIQWVNLKSTWKPFQIAPPKNAKFDIYNSEKTNFTFECWNHWPVGQIKSSGRPCVAADRVSHTSLSHISWEPYETSEYTMSKLLLSGLTDKPVADLLPLAKSWLSPPNVQLIGEGFRSEGYDPTQRAFVIARTSADIRAGLELTLQAGEDTPTVNPALVIRKWNQGKPQIWINGKLVAHDNGLRLGLVEKLDASDLILWYQATSTKPLRIKLVPETSQAE